MTSLTIGAIYKTLTIMKSRLCRGAVRENRKCTLFRDGKTGKEMRFDSQDNI